MERRNEESSIHRDQEDETIAQNAFLRQIDSLINDTMARNMINIERTIEDKLSQHYHDQHILRPNSHDGGNRYIEDETSRRQSERVTFKVFKSCGATEFKGIETPIKAYAWIENIEKVFAISHCWEKDRVLYAAAMFIDDALHWWNARITSLGEARVKTMVWKYFKEEFLQQFCPVDQQEKYEKQFLELQQGNKSVTAYEAEFNRKSKFATALLSSEAVRVRRFVQGLRWEIKESVQMQDPSTMTEATRFARMKEDLLKARDSELMSSPNRTYDNLQSSSYSFDRLSAFSQSSFHNQLQSDAYLRHHCGKRHFGSCDDQRHSARGSPIICHHCGELGHIAPHCPEKITLTCYECGEIGHVRRNCPHIKHPDNAATASVPQSKSAGKSTRTKKK